MSPGVRVDPAPYPLAPHGAGEGVQLVWIGSGSTIRGLEAVGTLLDGLGKRLPQLRLKLICDCFSNFALDGKDVVQRSMIIFRPKMGVGSSVDQLRAHPHPVSCALDVAFQDVRNA